MSNGSGGPGPPPIGIQGPPGPGVIAPCTVATLPIASTITKGAIGMVTDATATLSAGLGNIVAGTGSNIVPVYCDGTNWRIG